MTFIDFCAGIGGFRLGFEGAGFSCVGYVERDKFARQSYEAMYDTTGEWTACDITDLKSEDIPRADIWTFGFPCQDISVAGKQAGLSGERSGIFYKILELVKGKSPEDRPSYLVAENVKNLLSIDAGGGFKEVLSEMDEAGYDAEWKLFNSKDYGVPQNRERVYLVGHLRDRGRREVFSFTEDDGQTASLQTEYFNILTARYGAASGVGSYIAEGKQNRTKINQVGTLDIKGQDIIKRVYGDDGLAPSLTCMEGGNRQPKIIVAGELMGSSYKNDRRVYDPEGLSPFILARDYKGAKKIAIPVLTPDRAEKRQNGRRFKEDGDPMFTLTSMDRHGVLIKSANSRGYDEAVPGDGVNVSFPDSQTRRGRVGSQCSQTLQCSEAMGVLTDDYRIRKLTPRECFRLQGFPDELFDKAQAVNSDSQLYKQAGNAVTVNVAYVVGECIRRAEQ